MKAPYKVPLPGEMRCPEDTQRATATGILLLVGFSLWGKVVPSKELCNQPMAQPLVLPALLTLFVQVMMEQADMADMS